MGNDLSEKDMQNRPLKVCRFWYLKKMGGLVCSEAGAEISFCSVAVINKAF